MLLSLKKLELFNYTLNQIYHIFSDNEVYSDQDYYKEFEIALDRVEFCFSRVNNKYFYSGQYSVFDHLHGDQYSMYLYFFSNSVFRSKGSNSFSKKLFLLNKLLNGIDVFYEIELPNIFLFVHPLGTVLGRGKYSDYFMVYQRCGVGSNRGAYPELGKFTTLRPGANILGKSITGTNVSLAAGALALDKQIPDNQIYYGNPKNFFFKTNENMQPIWKTE